MNEIFLPLDRSPLVNMRRAIKRTNAKRLANLVIDSQGTRTTLKEYYQKVNNRYSNQQNDISGEETRFSYNQRKINQRISLHSLRRSENIPSESSSNQLTKVNRGNRQFRIKRYQKSEARCKSDLSSVERQNQQIDLRDNITVFNLIPKKGYLQRQKQKQREIEKQNQRLKERKKCHTLQQSESKSIRNCESLKSRGKLKLKFNASVTEPKIKQKKRIRSSKRVEFCPWNVNETFYNNQNPEQEMFQS